MPVTAQDRDTGDSHKLIKIVVGASLLTVGTVVAAKSSESTTVTGTSGTSTIDTRSTSQLVTGLVMVGAGGLVLWDGVREHDRVRPSTVFGVALGKTRGVFVRRSWGG